MANKSDNDTIMFFRDHSEFCTSVSNTLKKHEIRFVEILKPEGPLIPRLFSNGYDYWGQPAITGFIKRIVKEQFLLKTIRIMAQQ